MEENTENYTEISAEEFEAILQGDKSEYLDYYEENGFPTFQVIISNLEVKGKIFIDTESLEYDIFIKSGKFEEINFIEKDENIENLIEEKFRVAKLREYKKKKNFYIYGGTFTKIYIYSGQLLNLCIKDAKITSFLYVYGGVFDFFNIKETHICIFKVLGGVFGSVNISGKHCKFNHLEVNNGTFSQFQVGIGDHEEKLLKPEFEVFKINGGDFTKILVFNGIFQDFYIGHKNLKVSDNFSIRGGKIKKVTIHYSEFEYLHFSFSNNLILNNIHIISPKVKYLLLSDGSQVNFINPIHTISFENSDIPSGTLIKISDISVNNITFDNTVNAGNIIFSGVKSQSFQTKKRLLSNIFLYKENFIDFDLIEKENIITTIPENLEENIIIEEVSPTLKIHNSDLGKTSFIDCNFEEMELDFKSSKITEVFLAGTKMPKDITTNDNEQKRLGYGQLKKIYDNRGDTVTANEYFAKEMNVFLKKKGIGVGEKINVGLNWLSSNHGTSWLQALITTLLVAALFFCWYGTSIGIYPTYKWNSQTSEVFYKYIGYFVEFVNPLHKADYIPQDFYDNEKLKISGYTRFIDGISRIFIGYFVFQLIQAFRKHRRGS
jgi:hypothetical protein